ncbi:MAG TPA: hypothetical protein ENG81_03875 [Candidatus Bathyarchaeota archaeon]|nr:hypothetical protein [Candidatus Bathyarchaeota archaeon]
MTYPKHIPIVSNKLKIAILAAIFFSAGILMGIYLSSTPWRRFEVAVKGKPLIGIINVEGYLISADDRDIYLGAINEALTNKSIVGVIVRVDSPGGYANIVEEIYLSLLQLSKSKPLVALVEGLAASGGYYVSSAANEIYSVPTGLIGNIGVIVTQPPLIIPSENALETGPYKYSGFSLKEAPLMAGEALDNFVNAVMKGRGNRLKVNRTVITMGKLYLSGEALEMGLIDKIGGLMDAVNRAAEMAGVKEFSTVDLTGKALEEGSLGTMYWHNGTILSVRMLGKINPKPMGIYYLSPYYVEPYEALTQYGGGEPGTVMGGGGGEQISGNVVVMDLAHGNMVNPRLLSTLTGEIVKRGGKIYYSYNVDLASLLAGGDSQALIIANPTIPYQKAEIEAVRGYMENGGKLILIYDPATFTPTQNINMIAQEFGIHFQEGYIYDVENNYGVYRNIVVSNFVYDEITDNVNKLILFTATNIVGDGLKAARSQWTATQSFTEKSGSYTVIMRSGNVVAIGDLTFLLDPYLDLVDNRIFMENLVKFIIGG